MSFETVEFDKYQKEIKEIYSELCGYKGIKINEVGFIPILNESRNGERINFRFERR